MSNTFENQRGFTFFFIQENLFKKFKFLMSYKSPCSSIITLSPIVKFKHNASNMQLSFISHS